MGELLPSCRPLPPRAPLLDRLAWLPLGLLPPPPRRLAKEPAKLFGRLASDPGAPAEPFVRELELVPPCPPPLHPPPHIHFP